MRMPVLVPVPARQLVAAVRVDHWLNFELRVMADFGR